MSKRSKTVCIFHFCLLPVSCLPAGELSTSFPDPHLPPPHHHHLSSESPLAFSETATQGWASAACHSPPLSALLWPGAPAPHAPGAPPCESSAAAPLSPARLSSRGQRAAGNLGSVGFASVSSEALGRKHVLLEWRLLGSLLLDSFVLSICSAVMKVTVEAVSWSQEVGRHRRYLLGYEHCVHFRLL